MSKKTRFDLETDIMACWAVVDDVNTVYEYVLDHEDFRGMDPVHADKIANLLLGMASLYDVKFNKLFKTFEACAKNKELV